MATLTGNGLISKGFSDVVGTLTKASMSGVNLTPLKVYLGCKVPQQRWFKSTLNPLNRQRKGAR